MAMLYSTRAGRRRVFSKSAIFLGVPALRSAQRASLRALPKSPSPSSRVQTRSLEISLLKASIAGEGASASGPDSRPAVDCSARPTMSAKGRGTAAARAPSRKKTRAKAASEAQGVPGIVAIGIAAAILVAFTLFRRIRGGAAGGDAERKEAHAGTSSISGGALTRKKKKRAEKAAKKGIAGMSSLSTADSSPCLVCGKTVKGQPVVTTSGDRAFHKSCFRCRECSKDLSGKSGGFHLHGDKPYCPGCFAQFCAPRCAGCGDPCVGGQGINKEEYKTIEAMNLHWHAKCFRCVACGRKIMGLFMERMGRPVCNNCSRR